MSLLEWIILAIVIAGALVLVVVARALRSRGLHRWIITYARESHRRSRPRDDEPVHVLLCIADHFEPHNGRVSDDVAMSRVESWIERYPRLFSRFTDSDGRAPRHSFFYPLEEYVEREMELISELCRDGFGEVEVHLHHDHDTSASLRRRLTEYTRMLRDRHLLLASHRDDPDSIRYGFIHGNWALDNSRPDGRWCGVNNELTILRETGCYADFTLPSAPSETQTRTINSIYYATDDPHRAKSHDVGTRVECGKSAPRDALMLIQGPVVLDWSRRKIENACIQRNQAPSMHRLDLWMRARVQIASRPDWLFVKLHTHGAPEANQEVLLGEAMLNFHRSLAQRADRNANFHYHYVTAREMYNLAKAAESGWKGSVLDALDHELTWNTPSACTLQRARSKSIVTI